MIIPPNRLIFLDAMRGFTIAAMILVNFPGNEEYVFSPLRHTVWNGLTPTDLIAPFFLFIVGISIVLSYGKALNKGESKGELYKKIFRRFIKIYALGIFLNLLPDFNFSELRYTGVLARIAFVFLPCAIIFLNTSFRQQVWIGGLTLIAYWLAMTLIPTPWCWKGNVRAWSQPCGMGRLKIPAWKNVAGYLGSGRHIEHFPGNCHRYHGVVGGPPAGKQQNADRQGDLPYDLRIDFDSRRICLGISVPCE